jgi:polyvinyl alcohol dehydrogenase (cytochrome)
MKYLAALLFLVAAPAMAQPAAAADGDALYRARCAQCHGGGVARAPDLAALRQMPVAFIAAALTSGSMSAQAQGLSAGEIEALSRYLGRAGEAAPAPTKSAECASPPPVPGDPLAAPHWNGWGVDLAQRRFQPAAMAQLAAADVPRLKLKWAFGFPDARRADGQPTVVGGRLFVGSRNRKVYSLDAQTGCILWTYDAQAPVRTAISIGIDERGWTAYFGDLRANAYALDALTGKRRWQTRVDDYPGALITGAPALAAGVLYVPVSSSEEVTGADPGYPCCRFRGSLVALDAASGAQKWKAYSIPEAPKPVRLNERNVQLFGPSGAGIWSSPAVDLAHHLVYATTGDSYSDPAASTSDAILAFGLETGELAWSRQMTAGDAYTISCATGTPGKRNCPEANGPDLDFGASAMLVELGDGKRALVAGQKSGVVHAIDPDREGAILWQTRVGHGSAMGGIEWGTAADEQNAYVALSDVRVYQASTEGAQDSVFGPRFVLDPNAGGGLFALSLKTGAILWHTPHPGCHGVPGCSPAQSAAVTAIPGVVFSGGLDGHLRAYAASSGAIIWDVDTKRAYETVNGVAAQGGALDGPGAVVVAGMLYVNSGYIFIGGAPGNVLLAFAPEDKP